ncbi:MAG: TCR/Tet family MFS transporter [Rhodobacteraceae bacterium]|nr:TCR/Tet family MFS transporter [Paracoccaceae bacterium]
MTASPPSRLAVTFVLITVFLDMVGFGLIMPVLPRLIEEVGHLSLAEASIVGGWMFAVFSIGQFAFSPLVGNLSDRFGRRPLLLLAVFGLFVDYMFSALAPSLLWLFVGRAVAGICGSSYVIANAYIADVTPPEGRARAYGLMGAAFGLGFVLGPAIGGLLGEFGPRVPFYAAAGISFLNFVYGWFVLPETLREASRRPFEWRRANPFGTFAVFRTYPTVLPMCFVLFVFFFATSVYPAVWAFWGIANFGWSEAVISLTLAAFGIVTAIFQGFLTGPATAYFGEHRLVLIGLFTSLVAVLGYGLVGSLGAVLVLLLVHGPEGFVHPVLTALMSKEVPEDAQGELQGGLSSATNVAMLFGTVFYAQIFGYFMRPDAPVRTPDMAFFVAGGFVLLSLVLYAVLVGGHRREAAPG